MCIDTRRRCVITLVHYDWDHKSKIQFLRASLVHRHIRACIHTCIVHNPVWPSHKPRYKNSDSRIDHQSSPSSQCCHLTSCAQRASLLPNRMRAYDNLGNNVGEHQHGLCSSFRSYSLNSSSSSASCSFSTTSSAFDNAAGTCASIMYRSNAFLISCSFSVLSFRSTASPTRS